jgi:CheY-like chemotaxis protein
MARERRWLVLVVDDDPEVRNSTADVLRARGLFAVTAGDAERALEIMTHVVVDVLFTDIVMPGPMNGLDLARVARRLNPAIRVLCTTGFASMADLAGGDCGSCERLLMKPYTPGQLSAEIRSTLLAGR